MKSQAEILSIPNNLKRDLSTAYHSRRGVVFFSVARDSHTRASDADFLIEHKLARDAILHHTRVFGDAVKKAPQEFMTFHQEIGGKGIAGLRNVVIPRYFQIDGNILRTTVRASVSLPSHTPSHPP